MEDPTKDLIQRLGEILNWLKELQRENTQFQQVIRKPPSLENLIQAAGGFSGKIAEMLKSLQGAHDAAFAEAQKIREELSRREPQPVKTGELVANFRAVLEAAQLEARKPREGEVAATLKSLDVEVKGFLTVEKGETAVVTPAPGRMVEPGQLSTIRMSFGTIPVLRPPEQPKAEEGLKEPERPPR